MSKWKQISDAVYADLSGHAALTALLSNGVHSIYPLIADAEEGASFITYYSLYQGKPSKDGVYGFSVVVNSWAKTYNQAVAIADKVTEALGASSTYFVEESGKPQFNDQNEFYLEQIFNLKK